MEDSDCSLDADSQSQCHKSECTSDLSHREFKYGDDGEDVTVYGSFTNWKPKAMKPFLSYIEGIDQDKPDFLEQLRL